jgi:leucyl/phenylalanyl-tRNA--protein transferase
MPRALTELPADPDAAFPPVESAPPQLDGLLAWGGDLSPGRLVNAYRHGCFPWYDRGQPILWWSPDPRLVLHPERVHRSRSLLRWLRRCQWRLQADRRFGEVIRRCADIRRSGQRGTWILPEMIQAYETLHRLGSAHSIEVCDRDGDLVGGIYGVAVGRMFFGESMFSAADNGSKVALVGLCRWLAAAGWPLLDCQMDTAHLRSMGAELLPRAAFLVRSRALAAAPVAPGSWRDAFGEVPAAALAGPPGPGWPGG